MKTFTVSKDLMDCLVTVHGTEEESTVLQVLTEAVEYAYIREWLDEVRLDFDAYREREEAIIAYVCHNKPVFKLPAEPGYLVIKKEATGSIMMYYRLPGGGVGRRGFANDRFPKRPDMWTKVEASNLAELIDGEVLTVTYN